MRGLSEAPAWGGTLKTRAEEWIADTRVRWTSDTEDFYQSKLVAIYRTVSPALTVDRITPAVLREFVRDATRRGRVCRCRT